MLHNVFSLILCDCYCMHVLNCTFVLMQLLCAAFNKGSFKAVNFRSSAC